MGRERKGGGVGLDGRGGEKGKEEVRGVLMKRGRGGGGEGR